jgi:hypothetical protein
MAKTIATLVGAVFILVGIVGFLAPNLLGAHLTPTHNIIHLVSGAISLYLGMKGTLAQARTFCLVFGAVYSLLAVVGYFAGDARHMFNIDALNLMLGPVDHVIHILIGVLYLVGGLMTKPGVARATT